jgi:hypothetical protein
VPGAFEKEVWLLAVPVQKTEIQVIVRPDGLSGAVFQPDPHPELEGRFYPGAAVIR